FEDNGCACFLWEDVYRVLDEIDEKSTLLSEFLDFMKSQGLSPAPPLTVEVMKAFLKASDFLESLMNFASKLNNDYPWVLPGRFHEENYVHDAWGRVGIRFETKDWKPSITLGFLYDESNHAVTFVNREKGIDLMLRIEAEPRDTGN